VRQTSQERPREISGERASSSKKLSLIERKNKFKDLQFAKNIRKF
jgi:hypothetical protein